MSESQPQPQAANPDSTPNGSGSAAESFDLTLRSSIARAEIEAILRALEQTRWNRKQAARLLKISYRSLLYKIHNHSITQPLETWTRRSIIRADHEL
jgi:DNA-binding NtrC family response regulator